MKKLFDFEYPNVWEQLKSCPLPIVLYGMGNGADKVLDEFEKRGINAAGVMASDGFCRRQSFRGFTVMKESDFDAEFCRPAVNNASAEKSPDGAFRGGFAVALCFGSSLPEVTEHIRAVAQRRLLLVPNVPVAGDTVIDDAFIEKHRGDILRAYELLADESSRAVFRGALDFYYTGRLEYLSAVESGKDEVFGNILRLRNERYLDLGAYRGDTVDEFLKYTDGYESITAIEPNPKNFKKLSEHIADIKNAEALNAAAADRAGTARISRKAGRMPVLGDIGGAEVKVITVDGLGIKPTYIKADTEGMESAVLMGAQRTLRELKPKLNLAAYHRSEDFFSLILQLHEINPDYRIFLRKHPYIPCWDLNIYAISI